MTPREFLGGLVALYAGDCLDVLASLPEASVDSIVCDPPYELGFMGKKWDGTGIANNVVLWTHALRVLKPGGHLLAFSGTRTYHRMVCAIEDAGFEIRDQIGWAYGSGFPKSHDVSKGIDKAAGAEREIVGTKLGLPGYSLSDGLPGGVAMEGNVDGSLRNGAGECAITAPATEAAKQWEGWGTALKPAWEPIVLARKPLIGTVAENVLRHGTGAINVDGCRVEAGGDDLNGGAYSGGKRQRDEYTSSDAADGAVPLSRLNRGIGAFEQPVGRWPANIVHDGSDEVLAAFPEANSARANGNPNNPWRGTDHAATSYGQGDGKETTDYRDAGSAARFFYTAKADAEDRLGSKHPTVKPLDLMQWLVRLVTPKGGVVLDPFAGTGTTGEAAWREGMKAVLIEREPEYQADIARRMELAENPTKRAAVAKSKNKLDNPADLPLFARATG